MANSFLPYKLPQSLDGRVGMLHVADHAGYSVSVLSLQVGISVSFWLRPRAPRGGGLLWRAAGDGTRRSRAGKKCRMRTFVLVIDGT